MKTLHIRPHVQKVFLLVGMILFFAGIVATLWIRYRATAAPSIQIGNTRIFVEVMQTPQEMERGLSGRDRTSENPQIEGMLFVLNQRRIPSFWMKDMRFSLDFIWIDDTTVVDVTEQVGFPSAGTPDRELQIYRPSVPVTHVLEVPAGFVKEHGIRVGDLVEPLLVKK